jgi:hypothetical protein
MTLLAVGSDPAHAVSSDDQLVELWLHGRSPHTQRAYRSDIERFRPRAGKALCMVTLADLQDFADSLGGIAPSSRYRTTGQATVANPFFWTSDRSLSEAPEGRFSPRSHLLTRLLVTFR